MLLCFNCNILIKYYKKVFTYFDNYIKATKKNCRIFFKDIFLLKLGINFSCKT